MAYKNIKEVLVAAAKYPARFEEVLPEQAPKISTTLVETAGKLPDLPDFPIEIPEFPEVGALRLGRPKGVKEAGQPERERQPASRRGRTRFLY